jgi:hypothetical protein
MAGMKNIKGLLVTSAKIYRDNRTIFHLKVPDEHCVKVRHMLRGYCREMIEALAQLCHHRQTFPELGGHYRLHISQAIGVGIHQEDFPIGQTYTICVFSPSRVTYSVHISMDVDATMLNAKYGMRCTCCFVQQ